eukprot:6183031-Pleurochrysis_carterae.AAC.2
MQPRLPCWTRRASFQISREWPCDAASAVNDTYELAASTSWPEDEKPSSRLVFIGRNLPRRQLEDDLRLCVWRQA